MCENEVTAYFQEQLGESLPPGWFDTIEIIDFSIIFNNCDDYGATIAFGESVLSDHIIELEFEKREIVDALLNG